MRSRIQYFERKYAVCINAYASVSSRAKWNPRNWFQLLGASYHIEATQQAHIGSFLYVCVCLPYFVFFSLPMAYNDLFYIIPSASRYTIFCAQQEHAVYFSFLSIFFEINLYYTNHLEYNIFSSFFVVYFLLLLLLFWFSVPSFLTIRLTKWLSSSLVAFANDLNAHF